MTGIEYHRSGADRLWDGFSDERALEWTRVLRMHWPSWPGELGSVSPTASESVRYAPCRPPSPCRIPAIASPPTTE